MVAFEEVRGKALAFEGYAAHADSIDLQLTHAAEAEVQRNNKRARLR